MCSWAGEAPACVDWPGLRVNLGTAEPAIVNRDLARLRCL